MKILFLVRKKELPSSRVRVLNLIPELARAGINSEVILYPRSLFKKLSLILKLRQYDIVFIQKKLPSPADLFMLKTGARKLAYDFDDAVYCSIDAEEEKIRSSRAEKFKKMIYAADLVIAGNGLLAEQALPYNGNVTVVPSGVRSDGVPVKKHKVPSGKTVIGWVGTSANLSYLQMLVPALRRLAAEVPVELKVLSSEPPRMPGVPLAFVPWSLEGQEEEIATFDIGVMPLPATDHAAGKCGYKALQYMAAQVPPVVSDVGVNSEIVEHGQEGLVAKNIDGFYAALKYLIENPEDRRMMGSRARQKVERLYSIQVVGGQLAKALLELQEI